MKRINKTDTLNRVKLTANILFSGIGCQERGFENSGLFDLEVLNTSDINKDAVVSYAAVHCGLTKEMVENYSDYPSREEMAAYLKVINLGYEPEKNKSYDWDKLARRKSNDIEKYWLACKLSNNLGDISKIEKLPYAGLWTCSFPCFTADTFVLTKEYGYVPIKDVTASMSVLTHKNTYEQVVNSGKTGEKLIYSINAMCFDKVECTENHRFLVRTRHRVNTHIKEKPLNYRYFDNPVWKECKELSKNDYLGYSINNNSIIPIWEDAINSKIKIAKLMDNEDFWWIIGRYIADGFKQEQKTGNKIVICCGNKKAQLGLIEDHLKKCGLNYCTDDHKSCINYHICSNELYKFVCAFGGKAYGKFIPSFVFDMPVNLCKAFIEGYWSGDGCYTNNIYKATTISKKLVYGLGQLIAKCYHRPFSIYFTKRKPTCIIEGRTVNQKNSYSITFNKKKSKQDKAFYEDGYIWFPIKNICCTNEIKPVYDITVKNCHSFTANGAIVHNCTDISLAGKMKGLSPSDSTRSSLLWENIRLLKMAKDDGTLPKYIMFENVKNLVGKKFINDFNNLLSVLDELGFNSYWKVLNAKNCGVPQNRERVFVISIRKDIDNGEFVFPKPFDTGIRLKDILDENVDEKYYLSEKIIKGFQKHNENHKNKGTGFIWKPKTDEDIANTLRANGSLCPTDNSIKESGIKIAGSLNPTKTVQDRVRVLDVEGCSQSLRATDYKDPVKILQGIDKSVNDTQMIEFANCITAREDRGVSNRKSEGTAVLEIPNECVQEGNLSGGKWDKIYESARRYYSVNGCSPTIHTCNGGNTEPKISEPQITHSEWKKQMYDRFIEDSEGEVSGCVTNQSKSFGYRPPMKGYSKCLKAESNDTGVVCNYRIRKLTPNECWKLMGLTEDDCAKAVAIGGSDSQLYKQAGNGIVTNCCELLAEHLYKAQYDSTYVCTDENF